MSTKRCLISFVFIHLYFKRIIKSLNFSILIYLSKSIKSNIIKYQVFYEIVKLFTKMRILSISFSFQINDVIDRKIAKTNKGMTMMNPMVKYICSLFNASFNHLMILPRSFCINTPTYLQNSNISNFCS